MDGVRAQHAAPLHFPTVKNESPLSMKWRGAGGKVLFTARV